MSREEIYEQLNEVFQDVFDDEDIIVNDETTAEDIEDWDSLEHINLIVAVEKKFSIKFYYVFAIKSANDIFSLFISWTSAPE